MVPIFSVKRASWCTFLSLASLPLAAATTALFLPFGLLAAILGAMLSIGGLVRLKDRRFLLPSALSGITLSFWAIIVLANSDR